jgi:type II secretory pathway predicted ATPase ExeA
LYRNVLEFHGLSQDLDHDDFYPTEAVTELMEDITSYMKSRPVRFGVLYGCVGVGKSTILNILVEAFKASHEFTIAFMAHNDASKIKEAMITNKLLRMIGDPPKRSVDQETRYEILQDKLKDRPRMLLVIDDAHKLKSDTLIELKKTNENGVSILLAAHTQLARKLHLAMYEEIGLRAEIFEAPGIIGEGRGYLEFLMNKSGGRIDQFSEDAVDELSRLCRAPRQMRRMAWSALRQAVINNEKRVDVKTIHEVLPKDFSHTLVQLRRLGYTAKEIAEELMENSKRIIQCLHGRLPEDDELYKTMGVFLYGLKLETAVNE